MLHFKPNKLWAHPLAATALLATALVGCSGLQGETQEPIPLVEGKRTVMIRGLSPDWDLEDMVERSDAVAIGRLTGEMDSRTEPGGLNDPPTYHYVFTNYKFTVEEALYPKELPDDIAVLAETGVAPGDDSINIVGYKGVPVYDVGDRVLLFMISLADDAEYGDGASRPVPDGFTKGSYYLPVVGGVFGKLQRSGDGWEDSRTGKTFTSEELSEAIEDIKKSGPK